MRIETDNWAWFAKPETRQMLQLLNAGCEEARCIGGCVRDSLLGHAESVDDIDVATTRLPDDVMLVARGAGLKAVPTGLKHGTVTIISPAQVFEVTTLRQDVETDGRHATVAFSRDFAVDSARRDFTVNALAVDADGQLYDHFDGLSDLKARRLRFIGDAARRLDEDRLRGLRYFRFLAKLGWHDDDPHAFHAVRAVADDMSRLSAERVWMELRKLLSSHAPSHAFSRMQSSRILDSWLVPAQDLDIHPDALNKLDRLPSDAVLRLAWLLHGHPVMADEISDRLKWSVQDKRRLMTLVKQPVADPAQVDDAHWQMMMLDLGRDMTLDLYVLSAEKHDVATDDREAGCRRMMGLAIPVFPVRARDLLAVGIDSGPRLGKLLRSLESHWRSSRFELSRDELMALLPAERDR